MTVERPDALIEAIAQRVAEILKPKIAEVAAPRPYMTVQEVMRFLRFNRGNSANFWETVRIGIPYD